MRNKVIDLLDQTIEELDKEKIDGILEIPPKDDMGDFAFPCFQLAKVFRKAPNMIATEIAEKIPASEDVSKVEAMGPYVNFFLNKLCKRSTGKGKRYLWCTGNWKRKNSMYRLFFSKHCKKLPRWTFKNNDYWKLFISYF